MKFGSEKARGFVLDRSHRRVSDAGPRSCGPQERFTDKADMRDQANCRQTANRIVRLPVALRKALVRKVEPRGLNQE
jgi:hypothetical protein